MEKIKEIKKEKYYIYILRCEGNNLYTGIAKDYESRYKKHLIGKGAKYTKINKPIKIEKVWSCQNRSEASKVEYRIKKYSKKTKENLLQEQGKLELIILEDMKINIEEVNR